MSSAIYIGQVMHQRFSPMIYQFRYGVMSLKVDIDTIAEEVKHTRGLSLNHFNLYSVHYKDYGARNDRPWREWADKLLADYGLPEPATRIELICFPRFLGITFNPLAMWYAYNQQGEMVAIIGEVSNTFGQWHHYVLCQQGQPLNTTLRAQADKVFHVSPFIGMNCRYEFRFVKPGKTYQIGIYQQENGAPVLNAIQVGKERPLSSQNLYLAAVKHPFNTLKVIGLIHWWALKIWLKGGQFHKTPPALAKVNYSHTEMKSC
ncbi:MAG: DUF1365 domain-containing protein [Thiotrichales bacterium]|nr:DUF1365 domain-containing protein [Thiotrichales bacterium]